jgi:archaellum component FlaG (FlaF/FlaG flagellin family)
MKTKIRGLEPIVAAVLLIVVAVIGAMLVYVWFTGYVTKATSQAETTATSEKLKIEAASLTVNTDGSGTLKLYMRNIGGDAVRLRGLYVFRPGSLNALCSLPVPDSPTINPGSYYETDPINLPTSCNLYAGNDYVIKVVTQKGTEFAITVTGSR